MSLRDVRWQLLPLGGVIDPANVQKVATGNRSTALRPHTFVLLVADADSNIKFGDGSVSAASTDFFLPAKTYVVFSTGLFTNVAVIGGNLYLAQLIDDIEPPQAIPAGQFGR